MDVRIEVQPKRRGRGFDDMKTTLKSHELVDNYAQSAITVATELAMLLRLLRRIQVSAVML